MLYKNFVTKLRLLACVLLFSSMSYGLEPLLVVVDKELKHEVKQGVLDTWIQQLHQEGWEPQMMEYYSDKSLSPGEQLRQLKAAIFQRTSPEKPLKGVILVGQYPQATGRCGNETDLWLMIQGEHIHLQERSCWPKLMTEIPPYYLIKTPDFWVSRLEPPAENNKEEQGRWLSQALEQNLSVRTALANKEATPLTLKVGYPNCEGALICTPRDRNHSMPTADGVPAGQALVDAFVRDVEQVNSTSMRNWFQHYHARCTAPWPEYNPLSINFALLWRVMVMITGVEPKGSIGGELVVPPKEFFVLGGLSHMATAAEVLVAGRVWHQAGLKAKLLSGALTTAAAAAMTFVPYKCDTRRKFTSSPRLPVMMGDGTLPVKSLSSRRVKGG